ncbi:YcxB family protein [Psychrobacter lutiphocae]|uniref:YcxB family protein n=1 Tax=Psychrobacter lutiphocae TaxID=540500 RepID=UPI00036226C8|nr:YcxB family protein [Psychrobacter lutiphocae]
MALYPYTLQPIELNLSEDEFQRAQFELFEQSQPSFGLSSIKLKEWLIMAVFVGIAIAGIIFVSGYSTAIFYIMLILVALYLIIRTFGMKWYVKREFEKQMAEQEMPEEMKQLKLGVQKHGLIMSMPAPNSGMQNMGSGMSKSMRGSLQMRAASQQQAVIPWTAVKSWEETDDYIFMMFELQGQQGSQIIPKRLQSQKFPIDTVRTHLLEVVPNKGLNPETLGQ